MCTVCVYCVCVHVCVVCTVLCVCTVWCLYVTTCTCVSLLFLVLDDHSRVVLGLQEYVSGTDYINGSYIDVSDTLITNY